jgi:hypothetical protein
MLNNPEESPRAPTTTPTTRVFLLEVCDFNSRTAALLLRKWPEIVEVQDIGRNDRLRQNWQIQLTTTLSEYELDRALRTANGIRYLTLRPMPELLRSLKPAPPATAS